MIPTITKLIIKVEQLEWDLAEVKKELEELQAPLMKSLTPEEFQVARLARVRARNERRHASIEKTLGKSDPNTDNLTAEELQQLQLEEGVKPEDNIGSRAIIEERERRSR